MRSTAVKLALAALRRPVLQQQLCATAAKYEQPLVYASQACRDTFWMHRFLSSEGSSSGPGDESGRSASASTESEALGNKGEEGEEGEKGELEAELEGEEGDEEGDGYVYDDELEEEEDEDADDPDLEYFGVVDDDDTEDPIEATNKLYWDMMQGKLTREQRGDYDENHFFDIESELEASPPVPASAGFIGDLRTTFPYLTEIHESPWLEQLQETDIENEISGDPDLLGFPPEDPPFPGARPILRWELRMVLHVGPADRIHPANRKAKCRVYLRDLQEQFNLSDQALQHIVKICGPRYNAHKGELTLTSEKYPHREDNRREIVKILSALVDEGEAAFPKKRKKSGSWRRKATSSDAAASSPPAGDVAHVTAQHKGTAGHVAHVTRQQEGAAGEGHAAAAEQPAVQAQASSAI